MSTRSIAVPCDVDIVPVRCDVEIVPVSIRPVGRTLKNAITRSIFENFDLKC